MPLCTGEGILCLNSRVHAGAGGESRGEVSSFTVVGVLRHYRRCSCVDGISGVQASRFEKGAGLFT